MNENVKFERILGTKGNAPAVSIPIELMSYLQLMIGDNLEMIGDTNSKGQKYIAFWKKEE